MGGLGHCLVDCLLVATLVLQQSVSLNNACTNILYQTVRKFLRSNLVFELHLFTWNAENRFGILV